MNYIIDASIVIEYLIGGLYTSQVEVFFDGLSISDRLFVPEFCLLECTNVIWKQVRFNAMPLDRAKSMLKSLNILPLRRVPVRAILEPALDIALTHKLAAYDSCYIALAKHYSCPIVTLDQPQSRAAIAEGITLIAIL